MAKVRLLIHNTSTKFQKSKFKNHNYDHFDNPKSKMMKTSCLFSLLLCHFIQPFLTTSPTFLPCLKTKSNCELKSKLSLYCIFYKILFVSLPQNYYLCNKFTLSYLHITRWFIEKKHNIFKYKLITSYYSGFSIQQTYRTGHPPINSARCNHEISDFSPYSSYGGRGVRRSEEATADGEPHNSI